jgi:hypothetical protein
MTEEGCLGVDGKGKAPHWRLTEFEAPGGRGGNTWMLPTKDYLKWDGTKFRDDRGAVLREKNRKQNPGPQMKARVTRKSRPPLARKSRPLHSASGPQMKAISDTPPGPQMRSILRFTTLLHPCARYQLPSDRFAVSLTTASLFPSLKLEIAENRAKISSKPRKPRERASPPRRYSRRICRGEGVTMTSTLKSAELPLESAAGTKFTEAQALDWLAIEGACLVGRPRAR